MLKRLLIALGCLLLLPILGIAALFWMREPPDGPRVVASPDVVGIEAGGAYAWIVRTAHGVVLVDSGLDAAGAAILAELKAQGVESGQVRAVLLTHGHPDHYAAARLFERASIIIGQGDEAMLHGDKTHYGPFARIMGALLPLPAGPTLVKTVRGGEELVLDGATFTVIATPGHSPGSVMYLHDRVLFTGDSLMRKKEGLATAPGFFSEDAAQNRASLRALAPLTFDIVADGHAGVTTDAHQKLTRLLASGS
jgi:glyoxylase-like metal-dependent hydrolase (beta-lactamase superfamily II)